MPTIRDIKKLFRNDHKMSMLIDFLYRADQLKLTENELLIKIEGEWVEFSADLVASIPNRATFTEIIQAQNVAKYLSPNAFKFLNVVPWSGLRSEMPQFQFPAGVIMKDEKFEDLIMTR